MVLTDLWQMSGFKEPGLSEYAERRMLSETRTGIAALGVVSLLMLAVASVTYAYFKFEMVYIVTCSILAMLSLGMVFVSRAVDQLKVLYLLGMALLVVIGMAFVLLAHRSGEVNTPIFVSVVLLHMVMTLVPWGLREGTIVTCLIYLVFSLSTLSAIGRFESEEILLLQLLMLAAGLISLVVVALGVDVRKRGLRSRFRLEQAHLELKEVSLRDTLTQAWNRRFLDENFDALLIDLSDRGKKINFVLFDVDDFKLINDGAGHAYGDLVLQELVKAFIHLLAGNGAIIRMGGDEFSLLFSSDDPEAVIVNAMDHLNADPEFLAPLDGRKIRISAGVVAVHSVELDELEQLYQRADKVLYLAKDKKSASRQQSHVVQDAGMTAVGR